MEIEDLAEGTTTSDTPVGVWMDQETEEIIFQYGYVSVSMPVEDFGEFTSFLKEALKELNN